MREDGIFSPKDAYYLKHLQIWGQEYRYLMSWDQYKKEFSVETPAITMGFVMYLPRYLYARMSNFNRYRKGQK